MARNFSIEFGSISLIRQPISPMWHLGQAAALSPDWIPKTYLGLLATSNADPPGAALDFAAHRRNKDFRAMMRARIDIALADTGTAIQSLAMRDDFLDPGWTPPFDRSISLLTRVYAPDPSMADPSFYEGELGRGSSISIGARHPNSLISADAVQGPVVVNALIFFRAGAHTDNIGITSVRAPFHVPWVYCEFLVFVAGDGFRMLCTGSSFPSHFFYVDGNLVDFIGEATDSSFPTSWRHPLTIETSRLNLYPILAAGAPASGPQVPDTTHNQRVPADQVRFAAPRGRAAVPVRIGIR
jgi:hypothetical protein